MVTIVAEDVKEHVRDEEMPEPILMFRSAKIGSTTYYTHIKIADLDSLRCRRRSDPSEPIYVESAEDRHGVFLKLRTRALHRKLVDKVADLGFAGENSSVLDHLIRASRTHLCRGQQHPLRDPEDALDGSATVGLLLVPVHHVTE